MATAVIYWLSVNEAAQRLGLTTGRIRQLLISKEMQGRKLNAKAWMISSRELSRFAKKTGRNSDPPAP